MFKSCYVSQFRNDFIITNFPNDAHRRTHYGMVLLTQMGTHTKYDETLYILLTWNGVLSQFTTTRSIILKRVNKMSRFYPNTTTIVLQKQRQNIIQSLNKNVKSRFTSVEVLGNMCRRKWTEFNKMCVNKILKTKFELSVIKENFLIVPVLLYFI